MSHSQSGDRPGGDHDRVRVDKIYFYSISSHFILLCGISPGDSKSSFRAFLHLSFLHC